VNVGYLRKYNKTHKLKDLTSATLDKTAFAPKEEKVYE
jgi:hypothetical protein